MNDDEKLDVVPSEVSQLDYKKRAVGEYVGNASRAVWDVSRGVIFGLVLGVVNQVCFARGIYVSGWFSVIPFVILALRFLPVFHRPPLSIFLAPTSRTQPVAMAFARIGGVDFGALIFQLIAPNPKSFASVSIWLYQVGPVINFGLEMAYIQIRRFLSWKIEPAEKKPDFLEETRRGRALASQEAAIGDARTLTNLAPEFPIRWGGIQIPRPNDLKATNFCIIGSPGSGKSLALSSMLFSVLQGIKEKSNRRVFIYDAKRDAVPLLENLRAQLPAEQQPQIKYRILNPFDARSSPWALSDDVRSAKDAIEFATLLFPKKDDKDSFWTENAQVLFSSVMEAFIRRAPDRDKPAWTLRDVLIAFESRERLRTILNSTRDTRPAVGQYLTKDRTETSLLATIAGKTKRLRFVAAAWHKSKKETVSVTRWFESEEILILGNNPESESTVAQLNAAFVDRLIQGAQQQEEARAQTTMPETWIFLDELSLAVKSSSFERLPDLLFYARSKGVKVVIGIQELAGLEKGYGENGAKQIIGLCHNRAFLRTDDLRTREFASQAFGNNENITKYTEKSVTQSWGKSGSGGSATEGPKFQFESRPTILPNEFLNLPLADVGKEKAVEGYFDTAQLKPYQGYISKEELAPILKPAASTERGFVALDWRLADQLEPWTMADLTRLGLAEFPELLTDEEGPSTQSLKDIG